MEDWTRRLRRVPSSNRVVGAQTTGACATDAHGFQLARRRRFQIGSRNPPTNRRGIDPEGAGVARGRADHVEPACRRRSLKTAVASPTGHGIVRPTTVLSVRTPQVWFAPALTDLNRFGGGDAFPVGRLGGASYRTMRGGVLPAQDECGRDHMRHLPRRTKGGRPVRIPVHLAGACRRDGSNSI